MTTSPNDPAFPIESTSDAEDVYFGLTKREEFAARAMQVVVTWDPELEPQQVARVAVKMADALIAELNKS